jgi:hypothetical protein
VKSVRFLGEIVLQKSKNGLRLIFREKPSQATIADRCALKRTTEVAGEFIAICCSPPHDHSIARLQPGKTVFSDAKRLLQHHLCTSGHRAACVLSVRPLSGVEGLEPALKIGFEILDIF